MLSQIGVRAQNPCPLKAGRAGYEPRTRATRERMRFVFSVGIFYGKN